MHKTLRQETPVIAEPVQTVRETQQYLIINKPSSIPVHACGNFKYNSVQGILEKEMGYREAPENDKTNTTYKGVLKTVHRLDRQTSGIVFFAKTEQSSNKFRELME